MVKVYFAGDVFTSSCGVDHNVYMPDGAVIHTVQRGTPIGNPEKKNNDWYPADPMFEKWAKGLTVHDIATAAGVAWSNSKDRKSYKTRGSKRGSIPALFLC